MANGRNSRQIKRIRNEILVALKVIYPAALQAEQLMRTLLVLFPTLEFEHLKRDLHYLCEKGYLERVIADGDNTGRASLLDGGAGLPDGRAGLLDGLTPWRRRWFRLTAGGVEIAERCIQDPALEE